MVSVYKYRRNYQVCDKSNSLNILDLLYFFTTFDIKKTNINEVQRFNSRTNRICQKRIF